MGAYSVDLDKLVSPSEMLSIMLFTLGSQAVMAKKAAETFLAGGQAENAQIMVTSAGTVAAFIWPLPSRRKPLALAFPRRGEDLRDLLGLDDNRLTALKGLRDGMIHLDERIEESWIVDPGRQMTMWMTTENPVQDGNFMSWNPATLVFSFLQHEVSIPELIEVLDTVQKRSMNAFMLMLQVEDVETSTVSGLEPSNTDLNVTEMP